jgi:alpha-tubulin suppressor-like RCC1 family protein
MPIEPGAIAATQQATCALVGDGTAKCWGDDSYGQLGNGDAPVEAVTVAVAGLDHITSIVGGDWHFCALSADGFVSCWGFGAVLGRSDSALGDSTPDRVAGLDQVVSLAAGAYHTCALRSDGTVWCWGNNPSGSCGLPEDEEAPLPNRVSGIENAKVVAAGTQHSCAILADGSVKCWGDDRVGQLGDGRTTTSPTPVSVTGVNDALMLALGKTFSCALTTKFGVSCWGTGTPIGDPGNVIAFGANSENVCTGQANGFVQCFGANSSGQLGEGGALGVGEIPGLDAAHLLGLAVGPIHACVLLADGDSRQAWCWGNGIRGQTGRGKNASSTTPGPVIDFP